MPSSLLGTWHDIAAATESYAVVYGTLTFNDARLPKVDWDRQQDTKPNNPIPARLRGTSMTHSGFDRAFNRKLTLNVQCFGPWCGGATSGKKVLAFVQVNGADYSLSTTPCGGHILYDPTPKMRAQILQCFNGGDCPKPDHMRPSE